ncbi:MAG: MFS transporter [Micromonosporaceae bacterium]
MARLVNALGTGFALPFLPIYLLQVKGCSVVLAGGAIGAASLIGLLVTLLAARVVAHGAKAVAVAAPLASALLYVALLGADRWSALALVAANGVPVALLRPAQQTLTAGASEVGTRHRTFAWSQVAVNLGLGLGGITATAVVFVSTSLLPMIVLVNAASYVLAAVLFSQVPVQPVERPAVRTSFRAVLGRAGLRPVLVLHAGYFAVLASAFTVGMPLWLAGRPGGEATAGATFTVNTAAVVLLQAPLLRAITRRARPAVLALSMLVGASAWLTVGLAGLRSPGATALLAVMATTAVVIAVGECLYNPVTEPLVADLMPPEDHPHAFSALTLARQLGSGAGSLAVAGLVQTSGATSWLVLAVAGLVQTSGATSWLVLALAAVVLAVLAGRLRQHLPERVVAAVAGGRG